MSTLGIAELSQLSQANQGGGEKKEGKKPSNVFARKSNLSEPRSDLIPALAQMGRVHNADQAPGLTVFSSPTSPNVFSLLAFCSTEKAKFITCYTISAVLQCGLTGPNHVNLKRLELQLGNSTDTSNERGRYGGSKQTCILIALS